MNGVSREGCSRRVLALCPLPQGRLRAAHPPKSPRDMGGDKAHLGAEYDDGVRQPVPSLPANGATVGWGIVPSMLIVDAMFC